MFRTFISSVLLLVALTAHAQQSATALSLPCDTITVDAIYYGNNITTTGGSNGSITLVAIIVNGKNINAPDFLGGGNKWALPCTYEWLPDGETTSTIFNKQAGTYIVKTTTAQGCEVIDTIVLTEPATGIADNNLSQKTFTVSYNSVEKNIQINATDFSATQMTLSVFNSIGQMVHSTSVNANTKNWTTQISATNFLAGAYFVQINADNKKALQKVLVY